jgi:phospholipase/lecithinase/hemolysin
VPFVQSAVTLTQQIEHFKEYKEKLRRGMGAAAANHIVGRALYLFSVGASDFLGNYLLFPIRRYRFTLPEYEAYLAGAAEAAVRAVYALGARRVHLPGLPPLGCLPLQRTVNRASPGDCNRWHNMVARRFNRGLRAMVTRLNRELPGAQVVYIDVYRLLSNMIARPSAYGEYTSTS